jgi:hypothetical protein
MRTRGSPASNATRGARPIAAKPRSSGDRRRLEAGRRRPGDPRQGQIESAGADAGEQRVGGVLHQRDLDARMRGVERG